MPPVTKNLIIINFVMWLAMTVYPPLDATVTKFLGLHFYESASFNMVQPFTYMFVHGGFFHLFFNMFSLFFFGIAIENTLGSKRFLLYYMVCGVGAAIIQEAVWSITLYDTIVDALSSRSMLPVEVVEQQLAITPGLLDGFYDQFVTVGASGAIYGVLLAFAMIFPNLPIYFIFVPIPIKAKWMVLIWGGLELVLGMSDAPDGVAHFAHLGGMIFGFMLIMYWMKKGIVWRH